MQSTVRLPLPPPQAVKEMVGSFYDTLLSCTDERIVLWTDADAVGAFEWGKRVEELVRSVAEVKAAVTAEGSAEARSHAFGQWQRDANAALREAGRTRGLGEGVLSLGLGRRDSVMLDNASAVLAKSILQAPYLLDNASVTQLVARAANECGADAASFLAARVRADARAAAAADVLGVLSVARRRKRSRSEVGFNKGAKSKRARSRPAQAHEGPPAWLRAHARVLSASLLACADASFGELWARVQAVLDGGLPSSASTRGGEVVCVALALAAEGCAGRGHAAMREVISCFARRCFGTVGGAVGRAFDGSSGECSSSSRSSSSRSSSSRSSSYSRTTAAPLWLSISPPTLAALARASLPFARSAVATTIAAALESEEILPRSSSASTTRTRTATTARAKAAALTAQLLAHDSRGETNKTGAALATMTRASIRKAAAGLGTGGAVALAPLLELLRASSTV